LLKSWYPRTPKPEPPIRGRIRKVVLDRIEELTRHYELPDRKA